MARQGTTRLTRAAIVGAVIDLLETGGVDGVTTRAIGEAMGVHPTALYRHFRDMDELLREAADSILTGLAEDPAVLGAGDGLAVVAELCRRIRSVLMAHPGAAQVMAKGPSRMANEQAVTERMLGQLSAAGLPEGEVARAYHALIEFTVGSAAIDVLIGDGDETVDDRHRTWRAHYLAASPTDFPHSSHFSQLLYPSLEEQFDYGLGLLVDGLRQRAAAR